MKTSPIQWMPGAISSLAVLALTGCGSLNKDKDSEAADTGGRPVEASPDLGLLLSMTYAEAAKISPQKLELPPFFKVAADEIEVVKTFKDGSPKKVRAKGKVFLQIDFREPAVALCQEAYFGDDEVILRGRPLLQRGGSIIEGLDDGTVFYMLGLRLRAIGLHRLTNEGQLASAMPSMSPGIRGISDPALPWRGSPWEAGPNPLLPPLSPSAVPDRVRRELEKAAEAEAVLQQSKLESVTPLREEASEFDRKTSPAPSDDKPAATGGEKESPQQTEERKPADRGKKRSEPVLTAEQAR